MITPTGLLTYRDSYLSEQLKNSIAGLKLAIVSFDWNRGFEFYAREILQIHRDELKIPASDRLEIIYLLWPVLVAKENDLSIRTFIKIVQVLSTLLRDHQELDSLSLNWKELYQLIENLIFRKYKNPNFVGSKLVSQLRSSLILLTKRARRHFSHESTDEIINHFFPQMCIHSTQLFKSNSLFQLFVNVKRNHEHWLPEGLEMITWVAHSPGYVRGWMTLFARLAKENGTHIDWTSHLDLFFTTIIRLSKLAVGNTKLVRKQSIAYPNSDIFLDGDNAEVAIFETFAKLIAYAISNENAEVVLVFLEKCILQIKTYFHPSNAGTWSNALAQFIGGIAKHFSRRFQDKRHKLDIAIYQRLVEIVLPVLKISVYSRHFMLRYGAWIGINYLLHINPSLVFKTMIERINYSLLSELAAKQISDSLMTASHMISRASLNDATCVEFLPDLLMRMLPAIDINDVNKTNYALRFYINFMCRVPLCEAKSSTIVSSSSLISPQLKAARLAVLNVIPEWTKSFFQQILQFLQYKEKVTASPLDIFRQGLLKKGMRVFFMQISKEIHLTLVKDLILFVEQNITKNATKEIGMICQSAAHAYPAETLAILIPALKKEIYSAKKKKLVASENKLCWILSLLARSIRYAGPHVLPYQDDMIELITLAQADPSQTEIIKVSQLLLTKCFRCVLGMYPLELRSLTASLLEDSGSASLNWAPPLAKTECQIVWHVPNDEELAFGKKLLKLFGGNATEYLNQLITSNAPMEQFSNLTNLHFTNLTVIFESAGEILPEKNSKNESQNKDTNNQNNNNNNIEIEMANNEDIDMEVDEEVMEERKQFEKQSFDRIPIHFIPIELQDQEFRNVVNSLIGELTLQYLKFEHDFVPALSSLFHLMTTLLTTRLFSGTKYHRLKGTMKITKHLDKENDKVHKYPRYIYVMKEWIKVMMFQDRANYGFSYNKETKVLMKGIVQLFLSHYEGLNKRVGVVTKCFIHNPLAFDDHFFPLLRKLKEKETNENVLEASISILKSDNFLKRVCKRWDYIYTFLDSLTGASMHENIHKNIQEHVFSLFNAFIKKFHAQPLLLKLPEKCHEEFGFSQQMLEIAKEKRSYIAKKNYDDYIKTFDKMVFMLETSSHWKYQIMSIASILALYRYDERQGMPIKMVSVVLSLFNKVDLPILRTLLRQSLIMVMQHFRANANTRENVKESIFCDNNFLGWNEFTNKQINFETNNISSPKNLSEFRDLLSQFFSDKTFLEVCLFNIELDHNIISDESKDSEHKKLERVLSIAAKHTDINLDSMVNNIGRGNENGIILSQLVGYARSQVWPRTFSYIHFHGKGFSILNAEFWKNVFIWHGEILIDLLKGSLFTYATQENHASQCVLAEIVAGAVASGKHVQSEKIIAILEELIPIIITHPKSTDVSFDWSQAFRWGASDQDPKRLVWLYRLLSAKLLDPSLSVICQSQQISFLIALLQEFSWRTPAILGELLVFAEDHLEENSVVVRNSISKLLKLIYLLSAKPGNNNGKSFSSLGELPQQVTAFLDRVILKLNTTKSQTSDSLDKYRDTVLSFLADCLGYHEYYYEKFIPLALVLHIDKSEPTKIIAKKILEISSQTTIAKNDLISFFKSLITFIKENPSWHSLLPICHYLRIFVFQHSFYSDSEAHHSLILEIIDLLLSNNQFEVADSAKETLSSFIMVYSLNDTLIQSLITKYTELSQSKIQKNNNNVLHGLLGLSGLAKGQPYEVPRWLPEVLSEISNHLHSSNRILRKIASEGMKEFWRTHQDEWVFWQHSFTQDQIVKIKQSTSPSYFA